ncbi:hypothetical protein IP88_12960 [alpha proteobacterium AAP81b]|nr:hypothetical protein IP88_12960 [alpha proteobacterium AAP81b]
MAPVAAQNSPRPAPRPPALAGLDTGAPIDVAAGRIEIFDADNQAVFTGAVVIRQGGLTLSADRVHALYSRPAGGGDPAIERLDARGNVRLVTPSETATSSSALYDVDGKLITMAGNVRLNRGGSVSNGERLVVNLAARNATFNARAGGTTARAGTGGGQVTARFVPKTSTPKQP